MNKFKGWFNNHRNIIGFILLVTSIIILTTSLITRNIKPVITIVGWIMTITGMMLVYYDKNIKKRGFEIVKEDMRKSNYVAIPTRATKNSAAYDFYCNEDYIVKPNEIVKIWTDVKAYMQEDEVLILNVRSSMGGKFMLANTQGWVDSDYYNNPDNDGSIGIFLKNISNEPQKLEKGSRIAQGMFIKYLTVDNDDVTTMRVGGWGSSGR